MCKAIQNELICLCGEEIVTGVISEVKESRVFSTLADEERDCSNTEHMSIVIWFDDKSCQIRQEFIQFLECESRTCGQELYLKIVNVIKPGHINYKTYIFSNSNLLSCKNWKYN